MRKRDRERMRETRRMEWGTGGSLGDVRGIGTDIADVIDWIREGRET